MTRLLSGLALAGPLLALVWLAPPSALLAVAFLAALLAGWEYQRLLRAGGWPGARWDGSLDAGVLALAVGVGNQLAGLALTLILLRLIVRATSAGGPREGFTGAGASLLGALWIGGSAGLFARVAALPRGREAVVFLLVVVWANDIAAYYVGRAMGKRPLAPAISPGKTREGALGGLIAGAGVGFAWAAWREMPALGPFAAIPAALLLGVLSQMGDLFESRLKRAAEVKDAGVLIPGHGGLLDRIDGLLLAAPPFYYFLVWFLAP